MKNLNPLTKFHALFNSKSTGKKEARIEAVAHVILDRFYFRNDFKPKSTYSHFIYDFTNFSQFEKNEHDDAPDSVAGLAKFCRNYLKI